MNGDKTEFTNMVQCSNATGIPFEVLVIARNHKDSPKGLFGFANSGRVYWRRPDEQGRTLEAWINEHLDALSSFNGEDFDTWRTLEKRAKGLKAEYEFQVLQGSIVERQTVNELLERIANAQLSLFNGKLRQELPARLKLTPEQIKVLDGMVTEVFEVMQKNVDQWTK